MQNRRLALALGLALAACASSDVAPPEVMSRPHQSNAALDWRDQVIYQVMVDRFADGDPNNDINISPSVMARYHGGDWRGLEENLDYIQDLGATAIRISPVVRNVEEDAGFASYHGYWTQDFLRPNPHFGDLAALRDFVDEAHRRKMLVILDIVVNHVGQLFYYDINANGQPDDWISGGGTSHTCVQVCNNPARAAECSPDEVLYCAAGASYLERISEWDPEYDPRGVQGWTSLGFSGPAEINFLDMPEIDRTLPERPPAWFGWPADWDWFDKPEWYSRHGRPYVWWHEGDYSREFVRQQEVLGDFPGGLKDIDTDNPQAKEALIRAYEYWIEAGDFDGFRIDTLKHVDRPDTQPNVRGFWGDFTGRMRGKAASLGKQSFFMFGEAFDGNDQLAGQYTFPGVDADGEFGRLDGVFYFSQKYRVIEDVFKKGGPTRHIECLYNSRMGVTGGDGWCLAQGYYPGPTYHDQPHATQAEGGTGLAPQQTLVNFIDNHDLERFLHSADATVAMLHNTLFYLLTWDGIPCIYYGTEQQFNGGNDPQNREDLGGFLGKRDGETFLYIRDLIAVRKAHSALRRGAVTVRWATARARGQRDSGIFAFERADADETVLVILNTADEQTSETCAPVADGGACMVTGFGAGTVLVDVAPGSDGGTFTVGAGGTLQVSVGPRGGRILVP